MDKPAFFAILPAAVRYDARLKPMERILYSEITALADQTGYCYASNRYFIELYGVTDRAVQKWIKDLTVCGYITVEVLGGAGQGRCERRITPIFSLWDVRQTHEQKFGDTPEQKFAPPPNKSSGRTIQDNNTSNNNTTRACARGFDRFWAAYPRKVGKGAAERSFERVHPDASLLDKMLRAIETQRQSDTWLRGYIPNPATWLNQRRWEDEPDGVTAPAAQQTPHSPPPPTPVLDPGGDITKLWGAWEE
jgi:hypothetical protein